MSEPKARRDTQQSIRLCFFDTLPANTSPRNSGDQKIGDTDRIVLVPVAYTGYAGYMHLPVRTKLLFNLALAWYLKIFPGWWCTHRQRWVQLLPICQKILGLSTQLAGSYAYFYVGIPVKLVVPDNPKLDGTAAKEFRIRCIKAHWMHKVFGWTNSLWIHKLEIE